MRIEPKDRKKLLQVALGQKQADCVVTNIQMVNVITGEIYPAHIYISDNMIAHVETQNFDNPDAKLIYDGGGRYALPGLVDAHAHIESSMLTPRNFAKAVVLQGTTTVVTDPHEIGNVMGVEGVRYMHEASEGLPMRQYIDIPSCVPSVPSLEISGADFTATVMEELLDLERVIGLAEVMDFVAVCNGDDRMMDILNMARKHDIYIQGHAPYVRGRMQSAYLCGGPKTDHESTLPEDALEKLRNGMVVDGRESSIAQDAHAIYQGVKDLKYLDFLSLCTDDVEAEDLMNLGHLNHVVNRMIEEGMDPMDAIRCASLNSARWMRCENLGALAPGYVADMIFVEALRNIKPKTVMFEGEIVVEDGQLVNEIEAVPFEIESRNTMHLPDLSYDDFVLKAPIESGTITMNTLELDGVVFTATKGGKETVRVEDGRVILDDKNLKFMMVVNRHKASNAMSLGVIRNYGTHEGAVASSIAHDSHNLIVIYDTPENALLACQELQAIGGGMCAIKDEAVIETLALPLAGLMSLKPLEDVVEDNRKMKEAIRQLGMEGVHNPLLRIVFLSLVVIPEVRMSDQGLIDVMEQRVIPTFDL